jgi:hypothetical protein
MGRQLPRLDRAPPGARWRLVRPKRTAPVRAELARSSGEIETSKGTLHYEAGKHYIVRYGPGDRAPVRRAKFERIYRRRADGLYEKSPDVVRYFTLSFPVMIETLEGAELAHPGDWIMEGIGDELWPISAREAREKYEPA